MFEEHFSEEHNSCGSFKSNEWLSEVKQIEAGQSDNWVVCKTMELNQGKGIS